MNKPTDRKVLLNKMTEAGIRPSVQRLAVLEYVYSCYIHPTADDVYAALLEQNPMLSRTTVFNCLKLFAEKGMINDIDISSESTRYDYAAVPHAHFMCRKCRRIFDVPCKMPAMDAASGFDCDSINVFFKGLCNECKNNNI